MNKKRNLSGMSLNERLFVLSLMNEYDKAVKQKDKARILSILKECELSDEHAEASLEEILNPSSRPSFFKHQVRKLLLSYLIIYPFYYVIAMGAATLILWLPMGWDADYAYVWFKFTASIMWLASYAIHCRVGLFALMDSFGK